MPRKISVSMKKLPARSIALSASPSCFGFGNLNPAGGGPVGVAVRDVEVENAKRALCDGNARAKEVEA